MRRKRKEILSATAEGDVLPRWRVSRPDRAANAQKEQVDEGWRA
jgi:hypothetical protein